MASTGGPRATPPLAVAAPPTPTVGERAPLEGRAVVTRDVEIVVMEGGASRTVFKAPTGGSVKDPAWSPDGKQIAFAFAPPRPTPAAGTTPKIADQLLVSDIIVVDADGGNARAAVTHDAPGAILETPTWTPDGKALLFSYYAPKYNGEQLVAETVEIRRRDLAAGATTTVALNGSSPSASRDGKLVVFVGEDPARGPSLKVVGADGMGERELVKPEQFAALLAPRFSPDDKQIAFSAAALARADRSSGGLAVLRELLEPRAAFAHGLPWEIYTVPAAGGDARQLTQLGEDTPYSAWSADGARLLVYGGVGMYVVDARTGGTKAVSQEGAHGGMDWRSGG